MITCSVQAAVGAASVIATSSLPVAFYGSKVLFRSYAQAHFLTSRHKDSETESESRNKSYPWAFSAAARELVREAGGFEGGRRWPLSNRSTLLSQQEVLQAMNAPSHLVRHYSIVPKHAGAAVTSQAVHTAALELPPQQSAVERNFPLLYQWYSKVFPRIKGFSRKHALRQVNRRIISRVARRMTIGIPVLGFYFVSKLMAKDLQRAKSEYVAGNMAVASMFATALGADALDLAAQFTVISGLAHANLGIGLASAAALLTYADKASLVLAAVSFSCGLGGELLSLAKTQDHKEL